MDDLFSTGLCFLFQVLEKMVFQLWDCLSVKITGDKFDLLFQRRLPYSLPVLQPMQASQRVWERRTAVVVVRETVFAHAIFTCFHRPRARHRPSLPTSLIDLSIKEVDFVWFPL